jgi:hypothetical protein
VTIERVRYFTGQLLDEADFLEEQHYHVEKARRHNRMLHGWGVVCGLCVRPGAAGWELTVEPGYALDPYGNEIVVGDEVTVDLCTEDDEGNAVSPCAQPDVQRGRVRSERSPGRRLYLAIRYAECMTHPVPVGDSVEYSRTRESFAIRALTELPTSYREHPPPYQPNGHDCPDPLVEAWVILAEVVLDSSLRVSNVDCQSHRRRVAIQEPHITK